MQCTPTYLPTYVSSYTKGRLVDAEVLMGHAFTKGAFGNFCHSRTLPNQIL